MTYSTIIAIAYAVLAMGALIFAVLLVHVCFGWAYLKQRRQGLSFSYWVYIKRKVSRRNVAIVLVLIPVGVMVLIVLSPFAIAPLHTYYLRSSLGNSTSFVIRTGGHCHRNPERECVLLETRRTDEIESFLQSISLDPTWQAIRCACCGTMSFEFYRGEELEKSFSLHHDKRIRIENFRHGDLPLTRSSQRNLAAWLEDHGINERLQQFNEDLRRREL